MTLLRRRGAKAVGKDLPHLAVSVYELLIIDEIGYLPLECEQANLFFQVVANPARRARRS